MEGRGEEGEGEEGGGGTDTHTCTDALMVWGGERREEVEN